MSKHQNNQSLPKKKPKTLNQMSEKELQDLIYKMEYSILKLPKFPNPRIIDIHDMYIKRIALVRDLINSRKSMVKKS